MVSGLLEGLKTKYEAIQEESVRLLRQIPQVPSDKIPDPQTAARHSSRLLGDSAGTQIPSQADAAEARGALPHHQTRRLFQLVQIAAFLLVRFCSCTWDSPPVNQRRE